MSLTTAFAPGASAQEIEDHLRLVATLDLRHRDAPRHVGLAVSGGGDSVAMLWLVGRWARDQGLGVSVATVDHGLRPQSGDEARTVAALCRDLGLPHDTLRWDGWDGRGNLQARAREARRDLLAGWARGRGADAVLLGHTLDDQDETVLLRLARGSGVDGLSGMRADRVEGGQRWMRPLLGVERATLRAYLRLHGRAWMDDPSNDDDRFDRVKARRALAALAPLGIESGDLAWTAAHQRMASDALRHYAAIEAARIVTIRSGDVLVDRDEFLRLPTETFLRLGAEVIRWISGARYRPRLGSLQQALGSTAISGRNRTLGGTIVRQGGDAVVIGREPRAAARATAVPTDATWDARWRLDGPHERNLHIAMLGEAGIALCPDWRALGLDRSSVLASPAIWRGAALVAAPIAGRPEGWSATVATDFFASLRSP